MHTITFTRRRPAIAVRIAAVALALGALPLCGYAQEKKDLPADHGKHIHPAAPRDAAPKDASAQIAELRARLDRLEAALSKGGAGEAACCDADAGGKKTQTGAAGMSCCCKSMGEKKAAADAGCCCKKAELAAAEKKSCCCMGGMKSQGAGSAGMSCCCMQMGAGKKEMRGKAGMGMMKKKMMGGAGTMPMEPGTGALGKPKDAKPTAETLTVYHIGAREFFLDRVEQVVLSPEQQTKLKEIRVKAMADRSAAQAKIDQAEKELWALTGAESPNADQIEAQVRAVEKLRADQRLAFIRAVGEATKVLTPGQRLALAQNRIETPDHSH